MWVDVWVGLAEVQQRVENSLLAIFHMWKRLGIPLLEAAKSRLDNMTAVRTKQNELAALEEDPFPHPHACTISHKFTAIKYV